MNEIKPCVGITEKKKRSMYASLIFGAFVLYILFVSLNNIFASDIIFADMMLIEITEWLYQAIELAVFFIAYAFAIYTVFDGGYRHALPYAGIYAAAIGVRYAALFLLDWMFFGLKLENIPTALGFILINMILELAQYALIFVIALLTVRTFDRKVSVIQQGAARLKDVTIEREKLVFPYRKLPLRSDPLRFSSLLSALLIGVIRVANRIIYDISYGAPADLTDTLWMIAYYTADILIATVCYFILLYIIRRLAMSNEK